MAIMMVRTRRTMRGNDNSERGRGSSQKGERRRVCKYLCIQSCLDTCMLAAKGPLRINILLDINVLSCYTGLGLGLLQGQSNGQQGPLKAGGVVSVSQVSKPRQRVAALAACARLLETSEGRLAEAIPCTGVATAENSPCTLHTYVVELWLPHPGLFSLSWMLDISIDFKSFGTAYSLKQPQRTDRVARSNCCSCSPSHSTVAAGAYSCPCCFWIVCTVFTAHAQMPARSRVGCRTT
jgi:hypothetical protein